MMRRFTDRDRGSVSIWLALASFAMIVLVGLAVDLSGQVYAQQHATNIAAQAARAAGQQVDQAQAMHGAAARTDTTRAVAAARAFLASSGLEGSVTVSDGGSGVTVTTRAVYRTKFLSVIGIQSLQVTGSSDSEVVRAVNGTRR
ncbi:MAG: pilus assembly protein TadG-related protein [Propionibacteriaceae bacterium]